MCETERKEKKKREARPEGRGERILMVTKFPQVLLKLLPRSPQFMNSLLLHFGWALGSRSCRSRGRRGGRCGRGSGGGALASGSGSRGPAKALRQRRCRILRGRRTRTRVEFLDSKSCLPSSARHEPTPFSKAGTTCMSAHSPSRREPLL